MLRLNLLNFYFFPTSILFCRLHNEQQADMERMDSWYDPHLDCVCGWLEIHCPCVYSSEIQTLKWGETAFSALLCFHYFTFDHERLLIFLRVLEILIIFTKTNPKIFSLKKWNLKVECHQCSCSQHVKICNKNFSSLKKKYPWYALHWSLPFTKENLGL